MDLTTWRLAHANNDETFGPVITFDAEAGEGTIYVVGELLRGYGVCVYTYDGQTVQGLISCLAGVEERTLVITDFETNQEELGRFDLFEDVAEIRYL